MSFDFLPSQRKRIAVVGGGVSGLAACYLLAPDHAVTLFEAAPRLGGHARTVIAGRRGDQPVDTGFIVFNYANYPHLTRMFLDLDVPVERSDMTWGVSVDGGRLEYGLRDLAAVFGQPRNLVRPQFYGMLRDILRFNAKAEEAARSPEMRVGDLLEELRLGRWFRDYYLLPICGAIWSTPPGGIPDFPAQSLVRFFRNHALLSHRGQHQWWTVSGGSQSYVSRLETRLRLSGVDIRTHAPVASATRGAGGVTLRAVGGEAETFDGVIFACHSDQALAILADANAGERAALGAIRYQDNHMVLHRDAAQMPRRRACWSSWVYNVHHQRPNPAMGVTYWMNKLQNIPEDDPLFVTLNPDAPIPDAMIYDQKTFRHPVFDHAAIAAQAQLRAMQGQNATWFAGAYTRHGFHEDGFASAVRAVRDIRAVPAHARQR